MAHMNVFEKTATNQSTQLVHSEEISAVFADIKRCGSLKESALEHGIQNLEVLFPESKPIDTSLNYISRDMGWVAQVKGTVHRSPFAKIKSVFANITEEDARAKGYIKGNQKKEEFFTLIKRKTDPQTVYKLQAIDRDDVIDVIDYSLATEIKSEMRMMLDEELCRAWLVGDGRSSASEDKIDENHIRPIWTDEDLFTIKAIFNNTSDANTRAKEFIRTAIKARKDYKGSGDPCLYAADDIITDCLLLEDNNGRYIYDTIDVLKTRLRVREIITVPVMEGLKRTDTKDKKDHYLYGLIVNMADYNVGADKGGSVNLFDDFDIEYNKQRYLIETRCSGALTRPYSAIAIEGVGAPVPSASMSA